MIKRPCKNCKERTINCSNFCTKPAFLEWKTNYETIKKNQEKERHYNYYIANAKYNKIKKEI